MVRKNRVRNVFTFLLQHSARGACTCNVLNDLCDLFSLWTRRSSVLETNVGSKLFVTLGFVLLLHCIE
jgi:hypothetical protein